MPDDAGALLDFLVAADGERATGLAEVADVAVGRGDELHLVACAAHSAATPAAFSSASSGCAPNAMMRS